MKTELTETIRAAAKTQGLPIVTLERLCGIPRNGLSDVLIGKVQGLSRLNCRRLAEWLGWTLEALENLNTAHRMKIRGQRPNPRLADLTDVEFPLATRAGVIQGSPMRGQAVSCGRCPVREACEQSLWGRNGTILCEGVLERELLPVVKVQDATSVAQKEAEQ